MWGQDLERSPDALMMFDLTISFEAGGEGGREGGREGGGGGEEGGDERVIYIYIYIFFFFFIFQMSGSALWHRRLLSFYQN